ncbi:MAG: hypothetical protein K7J15_04985, partial [Candidatus Regiella insecticola]|nr:hypothetical protein [Candidatus Regiella insecticola]
RLEKAFLGRKYRGKKLIIRVCEGDKKARLIIVDDAVTNVDHLLPGDKMLNINIQSGVMPSD